ncbi:MAG TPA: lysophospholipid acyltransferase family protein [Ktedonobacteraceae bacterium]|jgi:KDO2-lipid IV(A) lauroyltransferase|nr:lysophospholipid acyltransferase family protein [Ktedonobacteraceae bacterium]
MYKLYYFASLIVLYLPRRPVLALSRFIGLLAWLFAKDAREQATRNMLHVFGPDIQSSRAGRRRLHKTVRGIFQNSARNYLEALYLPHLKAEAILRSMPYIEGIEHLEAALAQGKGVILFSAHFGPFDYIAQWFAAKGYSITIPVEHLQDERMLALVLKLRRALGVQFTPLGGSAPLRTMISALRKNQLVVLTTDRGVQGEYVEVPFFGAPARLPAGAVTLAQRTGAILLGAFGWRESSTRYGGRFIPVTLALPEEERANSELLQRKIVEAMEEVIRTRPDQWAVFFPIWNEAATPAPSTSA